MISFIMFAFPLCYHHEYSWRKLFCKMMTIRKDVGIIVAASGLMSTIDQWKLPQFKVILSSLFETNSLSPLAWAISSPAFTHSVGTYVENTWNRQRQCIWSYTNLHLKSNTDIGNIDFEYCVFLSLFQFVLSLEIYKVSFISYQQD